MQILGKRSKVLLIAVSIAMLVAIGVSFAIWDISAVKATNGDLSTYANAKVGDEIQFGNYYQSKSELEKKTPITWIVVDKDERTGQLTLMSKYILACGSYFGNYYDAGDGNDYKFNYNIKKNDNGTISYSTAEIDNNPYNQAYVDSTVRAYLNNLERRDMGGDVFDSTNGYIPSGKDSTKESGLYSSVGFSNQRYWTGFNTLTAPTLEGKSGFIKRSDALTNGNKQKYYEFYYQRPINSSEYTNRPATKGFLDEAFTDEEKAMIVPKVIAGYTGNRWPDNVHDVSEKSYVEGSLDKIWIPSATELNIAKGHPWNYDPSKPESYEDAWINPSDEAGSTVFEYFNNYSQYTNPVYGTKNNSVADAIKTTRTELAKDGMAGNFSIPIYDKGTATIKTAISSVTNVNNSDNYWTRSGSSHWFSNTCTVLDSGLFSAWLTYNSNVGVRPCVILKY